MSPISDDNIYISGNIYTTRDGDNYDSIILAQGVSAATLYYINSNIFDYLKIAIGTKLCLPLTCTSIYKNYTNLYNADPYWGSVLCVSTPGGIYSGKPINNPEPINLEPIDPPRGAPVANGTTKECSHWLTYDGSLSYT
ncbi:uncharacterized protein FTOL_13253 [Fusarium torulosum]|uniref:LysM domain-containing protein n=1 Tax=Fusarium torulosum TaxID=33205 RepID=A0AAE8MLR7_9HYPO|nr:uncharacterized protein FTOL_13253 [Fusarium torulosum]